jgi:outer membrane protein
MSRFLATLLLLSISLSAENTVLKESKRDLLQKGREEAESTGEALKKSWLGGVNIEGSYNYWDNTKSSDNYPSFSATLYQDIFRSGGIWWQVKKGKIYKALNFALLDASERDMIFSLYSAVLNIKKMDIELEKMKLLIANQKILIKNQEESYSSGILDISDLDESLIELNTLKNQEEGIVQSRIDLIASLKNLTDLHYDEIDIPTFQIPSMDEYLSKSFELEIQEKQIESTRLDKNLAYAQFLPTLSIYGSYSYTESDQQKRLGTEETFSYGAKLTIPIGFNAGSAVEAAQVVYLKAQSELNDKREAEKVKYEKILSKLKSIERREKNSRELIESYQSIQKITEEYFRNKLKTEDDVTIIKNRVKISQHDLEIYLVDRVIVMVELYRGIRG